jgi:hypothetical protein
MQHMHFTKVNMPLALRHQQMNSNDDQDLELGIYI